MSFLDATRDSYDRMATGYAEMVRDAYDDMPLDRALLGVFAEQIRTDGGGPVADVGCGPGHVTAMLAGLGLDAFGIDLSPKMIDLARRTRPGLRFEIGSMLTLDLPDAGLGGLLANYSIIHVPWDDRPQVFAEFHRVLAPGGRLMLVFQVGDDVLHLTEALGQPIDVRWYRQQPDELAALLRDTGFDVWLRAVREREGTERTAQGYVLARKRPPNAGDNGR